MSSPPEPRDGLRRAQQRFAAATRGGATEGFVGPPAVAIADRLGVYRNNAWQFFLGALGLTYPVLRRRVGEDYFRQLAHEYRRSHPSNRGDLHWAGAAFPQWLAEHLAGSEYCWLADLARFEWACEVALAATWLPPVAPDGLAGLEPAVLAQTSLQWQPSLQLVASRFPVWSVWQANQGDETARAVDLSAGAEHCAIVCTDSGLTTYRLEAADYALLQALCAGHTLADVVEATAATAESLTRVLGWAFAEELVTGVSPSVPA